MKKIIMYCLTILIASCNQKNTDTTGNITLTEAQTSQFQKKEEHEKPRTEKEIISSIRKKSKIINNNINSYKKVTKSLIGESSEGGSLEGYYENEELKKITTNHYGEMGKLIEQYYFWKNDLFFVFTQDFTYNMPMHMDASIVNKIEENRYYFDNDTLVRWLDPEKEKVANSKFSQKEAIITQEAKKLQAELKE